MGWLRKTRALFHRDKLDADIEEELNFHLAMRVELNAAQGMTCDEGRADARRRFGNTTRHREDAREADMFTFVESIAGDLRFAARMLAKHAGFTALAVVALATGIGINTAVFTAYKAFLLRPIDGVHPEELFNIYHSRPGHMYDPQFSYLDYQGLRDTCRSFGGILAVAVTGDELTLTEAAELPPARPSFGGTIMTALGFHLPAQMTGGAEYVRAAQVSANFFSVLGVNTIRGRVFLQRDAAEIAARPQVLISENYWRRRFGGDPAILTKSVKLNGVSFSIIGVTPRDFMGTFTTEVPDFWMPLDLEPRVHRGSGLLRNREKECCLLYGRLSGGVSVAAAQAETQAILNRLRPLHAAGFEGSRPLTVQISPGSPFARPQQDPRLKLIVLVTLGAVGLVLLIACANVAGMELARSAARQREIGVRLSLGASRARLIRQLLTESALMGLLAGALAMLASIWAVRFLVVQAAAAMPVGWGTFSLHVRPDVGIFLYVFVLSVAASLLFGLAPALESSRPDLTASLKEEGARFAFRLGNRRLRDILLAAQAGICLFLLVLAGLMIHSSTRALHLDTGYEAHRVIDLEISFPVAFNYTHDRELVEIDQIRRRIALLSGVSAVTSGRSPDGGGLRTARVPGGHTVFYSFVQPDYFQTLDIPIVAGRTFNGRSAQAVMVSQSAASAIWPGADPVGRTLRLDLTDQFRVEGELTPDNRTYVVAGVARDTRGILLDGSDSQKIYLPLPAGRLGEEPLLVRAATEPLPLLRPLGAVIHAVDPNLIVDAITLEDALSNSPQFVIARCSGLFASIIGLLGLLLASAGIYGGVSYAVVRRTREVGIRVALGASRRDVFRLVLGETARPVLVGLVTGLVVAAAAAQLLRALLNGLSPLDPWAFLGVSVFFLAIALLAACVPARRALRVEPMAALRCD